MFIKGGDHQFCLDNFTIIVNNRARSNTASRTYANTECNFVGIPEKISYLIKNEKEYDFYYPTIILDCVCEQCHPKQLKQHAINRFFHRE